MTLATNPAFDTVRKDSRLTLSNNNMTVKNTVLQWQSVYGSQGNNAAAKSYFEVENTVDANNGAAGYLMVGLGTGTTSVSDTYPGASGNNTGGCVGFQCNNISGNNLYKNSASALSLPRCTQGQKTMVAVDFANGKMWFGVNGTWSGNPVDGTAPAFTFNPGTQFFPIVACYDTTQKATINFGATAFAHAIPAGFSAWNQITELSWLDEYAEYTNANAVGQTPTIKVDFNFTLNGAPYTGQVQIFITTGLTTMEPLNLINGPLLSAYFPASKQNVWYPIFIYAPNIGDNGLVTGFRVYAVNNQQFFIELTPPTQEALDATITGSIHGTITRDGAPASREVMVFALENDSRKLLAKVRSGNDGAYSASWVGYAGTVLAVAMDDYGVPFLPLHNYAVGDRIIPTLGLKDGVYYECITDGVSGAREPIWWTTPNRYGWVGTAQFIARSYYGPFAGAPIAPHVVREM